MRTVSFGFGSANAETHLDDRRSFLKQVAAVIYPTFFCMLVTAFALLQPYSSASQSADAGTAPSVDPISISSDACAFADMDCIRRQSQIQIDQTQFLARQYPLILKTAQDIRKKQESLPSRSTPDAKNRLVELRLRVHVMTVMYNAGAVSTDPSLLNERHLPAQLSL